MGVSGHFVEELNESGVCGGLEVRVRVGVNWKYPVFHSLRSADRKQNQQLIRPTGYCLFDRLPTKQQNSVKRAGGVLCVCVLGGEGRSMMFASTIVDIYIFKFSVALRHSPGAV